MRKYKKYKSFTESDFITDPYFQDCVKAGSIGESSFWIDFFQLYPHKKVAIENARIFLESIVVNEEKADEKLINDSFVRHLMAIQKWEEDKLVGIGSRLFFRRLMRVAAIFGGVALVIASLLIFFNNRNSSLLVKTDFGDIRSVVLPDGSRVVLNANSTITFNKTWSKDKNREVWLKGEAFFNVSHINRDTTLISRYEHFLVHTDALTVEVLGTSFDIRQRRGTSEVVLEEGKISVAIKGKKGLPIMLKPGDKLYYNADEDKLVTTTTNAENFSAWRERKLLLQDATVSEIVQYLEDNFGKKIILENPDLSQRKIEGPILLTNLDDALFVLSTVLNTETIKKDDSIIIRSR